MGNSNKVISGTMWSVAERVLSFIVSTVISVILARLICPSDYGVIALVTVFVNIFTNVLMNGLGMALVQHKNITYKDYSTVYIINICVAIIAYILMFFAAPYIARFYSIAELTKITRVISLIIPFAAISSVQYSFLQKNMQFRKYCIVTLGCTTISGAISIIAALNGFGIWSLVLHYVSKQFIESIILVCISGFRFKLSFSIESAKKLLPYGIKSVVTTFINDLEANVRSLIVGKAFSSADLAFYNQGSNFPTIIINNINSAVGRVVFPMFSQIQDEKERYKETLRKAVKLNLFVIVPALAGLIGVANSFILALYTEKWIEAVPYLQIIALAYITRPYENMCNYAIMGSGRSGTILFDMIVTKSISIVTIFLAVFYFKSVIMIAWGVAITTVVGVVLFAIQVKQYFDYSFLEQLKDVLPIYSMAAIMLLCVFLIGEIIPNPLISLAFQVPCGIIIYALEAYILKIPEAKAIVKLVKGLSKRGGHSEK